MPERDVDYAYESSDPYCYPGSHVLRNKLGLTNADELAEAERSISMLRLAQMDKNGDCFPRTFDAQHLQAIHRFAFSDLFEWAGEYRTVNIAKGSFFCVSDYIPEQMENVFTHLRNEKHLAETPARSMAARLAYYLGEINAIHPFREGNGRAQRAFVRQLAYENGYLLSFARTGRNEMIQASVSSFNGSNEALEHLVAKSLSKR